MHRPVAAIVCFCVLQFTVAYAQQPSTSTATLPHLTVSISMSRNYADAPIIVANFSTDDPAHHSVICMSGADFKVVLRDSSGKLIPMGGNIAAAFQPVQGGGGVASSSSGAALPIPDPCAIPLSSKQLRALLSDLYPDLTHGEYFLQVTVAPAGSADQAILKPFDVRV